MMQSIHWAAKSRLTVLITQKEPELKISDLDKWTATNENVIVPGDRQYLTSR